MQTAFDIGDFVWALFKVKEINVTNKDIIKYNLREVSDNRSGIDLLNKEEKELVRANFEEEYDIDSATYRTKIYRIVESEEKIGEWSDYESSDGVKFIKCSNCKEYIVRNAEDPSGYRIVANFKPKYCPWCGAKMKETEE